MSGIDKASATWAAVRTWATEQKADALKTLTTRGLGIEATEFERGRLTELEALLALENPRRITVGKPDTYGR